MSAYRIDKGVPLPPRGTGHGPGGEAEFPFRQMAKNDSFRVEANVAGPDAKRLYQAAANCRRYTGFRFAIRKLNGGFYRVWRTK